MSTLFRTFLVLLLASYPAIQAYFGWRHGAKSAGYSRPDKQIIRREGIAMFVIQAVAFFGMLICVLLDAVYPRVLNFARIPIPMMMRWAAVGIAALSLMGLVLVHRELGRFWSAYLDMKSDHELIASGPYRWIRHPMYTVLIVHTAMLGVIAADVLLLALGLVRVAMFLIRIPREEAMLTSRFGERYREYASRRGRLLPRFRRGTLQ